MSQLGTLVVVPIQNVTNCFGFATMITDVVGTFRADLFGTLYSQIAKSMVEIGTLVGETIMTVAILADLKNLGTDLEVEC